MSNMDRPWNDCWEFLNGALKTDAQGRRHAHFRQEGVYSLRCVS
jgi:hypothetical protein